VIAWGHSKIGIGSGVIQHLQLSEQPGLQTGRNLRLTLSVGAEN
jgi:hypothetical protein